jgi:hypothetical protein
VNRRVGATGALLAPVLVALAVAAVLAGPVADVPPASAQSQNRAVVIVHTGGGSAAVCVRFDEPSISGLDALQRAGLGAVVRSFSGQGGAVCGLNGVGCPADDSCLTCQAPNYWAYHRAPPGAGGFTFSSAGAGSTRVSDGSVEGWQWGTGAAPPFQTVDQVCGAADPPSAPPNPAPVPRGESGPNPPAAAAPGGEGTAGATPDQAATTTDPVTTTSAAVTTTTSGADDSDETAAADDDAEVDCELAAVATSESGDSGSPWAVALFMVLIAGIGVAAIVIRRRRAL